MTRKKATIYTSEQKQKLLNRVDAFAKTGLTIQEACEKAGIHWGSYYKWRRAPKSTKVVTYNAAPRDKKKRAYRKRATRAEGAPERVVVLIGSPDHVARLMEGVLNGN